MLKEQGPFRVGFEPIGLCSLSPGISFALEII